MGNRGGESVPTLPLMQSLTSECSTASQPLVIEVIQSLLLNAGVEGHQLLAVKAKRHVFFSKKIFPPNPKLLNFFYFEF